MQEACQVEQAKKYGILVAVASACALTYSQIIANKRAKGEAELRQLRVMSVRARSLKVVVVNVLALQEEGEGRSRVNAVASAVDVRCGSFSLDLAVVDTDEELESAATLLEHRACALQAVCKQFLVLSASYALIGVSSCREYKWMRQEAQKLCDNVATLAEQVERKVRALQARG